MELRITRLTDESGYPQATEHSEAKIVITREDADLLIQFIEKSIGWIGHELPSHVKFHQLAEHLYTIQRMLSGDRTKPEGHAG
jgi:hypothetical protein